MEIDEGAEKAMLEQGRSLLAAGIKLIEGDFEAGSIVAVYSQKDHRLIGKGRVKISSANLQAMCDAGLPEGIFIHRNDWVSL